MAKTRRSRTVEAAGRAAAYWLHGTHAVRAALANPARRADRLLATRQAAARLADDAPPLAQTPAPEIVPREEIERHLPPDTTHQGLALHVAPLAEVALGELARLRDEAARVLVLDRVADPRNVGAVVRAAAAFDVACVVLPRRHSPPEGGALAKAASGALEWVPLVRVANLARTLDALAMLQFWRLGLDAEAGTPLSEAVPSGRLALVLGAEGSGLRRLTAERCDALARIELAAPMASLNVSQAAAIALHATRPGRPGA